MKQETRESIFFVILLVILTGVALFAFATTTKAQIIPASTTSTFNKLTVDPILTTYAILVQSSAGQKVLTVNGIMAPSLDPHSVIGSVFERPADMSKVDIRVWTKDGQEWVARWEKATP